jgi:two-component SAPR family response regulator
MLDEYINSRLRGRRVLIVEDDYLQAQYLADLMEAQGAEAVGPVSSVDDALSSLLRDMLPDFAILDVQLGREKVFPLVEALRTLNVPFVFTTAYPDWSLPEPYDMLPHCEKPLDERQLLRTLAMLSRAC